MTDRPCNCGSGQPAPWRYDARGIELMLACDRCWPRKSKRYRPEVLWSADYYADEPIEPDDY